MSILASLAAAKQKATAEITPRQNLVKIALERLGLGTDIIDDVLLEPAENWWDFVSYFEEQSQ